jgi:GNAT superfamily N-acetyltransferase
MQLREIQPGDTGLAFLAMTALRTHVADEAEFVRRVDEVQRPQGYRLVGAFDREEPAAAAVAGFREGNSLAWGHFLYVDDLATRPEFRRRGLGTALLVWLAREAAQLGCEELHLDSGVQHDRADAHRLYFNSGLTITSHHFARNL